MRVTVMTERTLGVGSGRDHIGGTRTATRTMLRIMAFVRGFSAHDACALSFDFNATSGDLLGSSGSRLGEAACLPDGSRRLVFSSPAFRPIPIRPCHLLRQPFHPGPTWGRGRRGSSDVTASRTVLGSPSVACSRLGDRTILYVPRRRPQMATTRLADSMEEAAGPERLVTTKRGVTLLGVMPQRWRPQVLEP